MHRRVPLPTLTIWGRLAAGPDGTEILTDFKMVSAGVAFSPPTPTLTAEMGCGPQAHVGLHIPNEGMQGAEGSTEVKNNNKKITPQRTADT